MPPHTPPPVASTAAYLASAALSPSPSAGRGASIHRSPIADVNRGSSITAVSAISNGDNGYGRNNGDFGGNDVRSAWERARARSLAGDHLPGGN